MRKKLLLGLMFSALQFVNAQEQNNYELYFSTKENKKSVLTAKTVTNSIADILNNKFARKKAISIERAIPLSDEDIERLAQYARDVSGNDTAVYDLKNIYKIVDSENNLKQFKQILKKHKTIEEVSIVKNGFPDFPATIKISNANKDRTKEQTYLNADAGVNMLYAWGKGYTGQGVFIKDVECCYNQNHIEFKGKKILNMEMVLPSLYLLLIVLNNTEQQHLVL